MTPHKCPSPALNAAPMTCAPPALPRARRLDPARSLAAARRLSGALLLLGCTSCASPDPGPRLATRLVYPGTPNGPLASIALAGRVPSRERSARILVGRMASAGTVDLLDVGEGGPLDARQARRIAAVSQWTITRELGIPATLGLTVVLVPAEQGAGLRIEADLPASEGMAFGAPTREGRLPAADASRLLFALVFTYVKSALTEPAVAGCALTRRDPRCQWVAEGVAGLVATLAMAGALRDKEPIIELEPLGYHEELERLRPTLPSTLRLVDPPAGGASEGLARQAAAEYLCSLWYAAAKKRGEKQPLAKLVAFTRAIPFGPTYEDLTAWLQNTSGIRFGAQGDEVPLDLVTRFHRENWLQLGWKRAPDSSQQKAEAPPGARDKDQ